MIFLYAALEKFFGKTKARKQRGGIFVSSPIEKGLFLDLKTELDGKRLKSFIQGIEEFYKKKR